MVNLSGDAAERFDVVAELLELDVDISAAEAIDLAVYILEGASADFDLDRNAYAGSVGAYADAAELLDSDEVLAAMPDWEYELLTGIDRRSDREAAKAAHPCNRVLVEQFSRGLDYSLLAEGHNVEQEDDEPEAVVIHSKDWDMDEVFRVEWLAGNYYLALDVNPSDYKAA